MHRFKQQPGLSAVQFRRDVSNRLCPLRRDNFNADNNGRRYNGHDNGHLHRHLYRDHDGDHNARDVWQYL